MVDELPEAAVSYTPPSLYRAEADYTDSWVEVLEMHNRLLYQRADGKECVQKIRGNNLTLEFAISWSTCCVVWILMKGYKILLRVRALKPA